VNTANVGVADPEGGLYFVEETLETRLIALYSLRQELESNRLAEFQIIGTVNLAHTASAQESDDAVTPRQYRTRYEAGLIQ